MSSKSRRPANTQKTSNNQSDKSKALKMKTASTNANKRTKRTAFSKQRIDMVEAKELPVNEGFHAQ